MTFLNGKKPASSDNGHVRVIYNAGGEKLSDPLCECQSGESAVSNYIPLYIDGVKLFFIVGHDRQRNIFDVEFGITKRPACKFR